jgi:putative (di)nucleoside polyphosphate hydrolase
MAETPDKPGRTQLGYRPCVGVMVLNRQGLVWVGRRSDAPGDPEGRGTWWQMPQGGIDENEDPRQAVLRELYEETGMRSIELIAELSRPLTYDGKAWGGRYRGQRQRWYAVRFLGPDSEISLEPPAGHKKEFDAWRWAPLPDLLDLVVPFKRDVYAAVANEFAALARPL